MGAASISWCMASCSNDSSASEARELPDAMRAAMLSSFWLATSFIKSSGTPEHGSSNGRGLAEHSRARGWPI